MDSTPYVSAWYQFCVVSHLRPLSSGDAHLSVDCASLVLLAMLAHAMLAHCWHISGVTEWPLRCSAPLEDITTSNHSTTARRSRSFQCTEGRTGGENVPLLLPSCREKQNLHMPKETIRNLHRAIKCHSHSFIFAHLFSTSFGLMQWQYESMTFYDQFCCSYQPSQISISKHNIAQPFAATDVHDDVSSWFQ
jgi:hypothetical protein